MPKTAIEKSWPAVAPQAFIADGTQWGIVSVADSRGFKVKQKVILVATGLPDLEVKIMPFLSPTQFYVGPPNPTAGQGLTGRADIRAYTVLLGAYVYAADQPKVNIKPEDIIQAVYRQEPGTTIGVEIDDQWGNPIDSVRHADGINRLAVDAAITLESLEIGTVDQGNPNIPANAWPVEVFGPNGNSIEPNIDGSINVNIVSAPISGQEVKSLYSQVLSIASGATTALVTYTVPPGKTAILERANASGENIARYDVLLNNALFDTRRTMFGGDLTTDFDYTSGNSSGFILNSGDVVKIQVLHNRPSTGTFNARLQVLEIT